MPPSGSAVGSGGWIAGVSPSETAAFIDHEFGLEPPSRLIADEDRDLPVDPLEAADQRELLPGPRLAVECFELIAHEAREVLVTEPGGLEVLRGPERQVVGD